METSSITIFCNRRTFHHSRLFVPSVITAMNFFISNMCNTVTEHYIMYNECGMNFLEVSW